MKNVYPDKDRQALEDLLALVVALPPASQRVFTTFIALQLVILKPEFNK